ncbi:MAG: hypothetical protein AB7V50_02255 [Vampirovibrionia bacterium]
MTNLLQTRNYTLLITFLLGIVGFCCFVFVNLNYAVSFMVGALVGVGYLFHLSSSVEKLAPENKKTNTVLRLFISIVFMLLIVKLFSLNLVFICLGFFCNHLAIFTQVVSYVAKNKVGQNCK